MCNISSTLDSVISEGGSLDTEIDRYLGNASKAFGALKRAVCLMTKF